MRVEELLESVGLEQIEAAVRAAERTTSGEIVPLVTDRSHGYAGVRAAAAALLAFAAGIVAIVCARWLEPDLDLLLWLPPAQVAVFAAAYVVCSWRPLLRQLIPARIAADVVNGAARLAFLDEGLYETRDRTGILLYLSLLEHRVVVLADSGIDSLVEPGTWDAVVDRILEGIRSGRAEAGLCEAIAMCGELLASRFPAGPGDSDELSNVVRVR